MRKMLILTLALTAVLATAAPALATCCGGGGEHTIRTPQPKTTGLAGRPIVKPVPPRTPDAPPDQAVNPRTYGPGQPQR